MIFNQIHILKQCVTFAFLFVVCVSFNSSAQTSRREHALKAGLIFNFARYSHRDPFIKPNMPHYVICSSSKPFIEVAQKTLAGKIVSELNIRMIHVNQDKAAESLCDIIFFNDIDTFENYITSPHKENKKPMLIGEMTSFIHLGGHINFIYINGKIRFEINPEQLQASGIKVSSKVIRLGKIKRVSN